MIPRVTEILKAFDPAAKYYKQEAAERGTNVHLACEYLDSEDGLDLSSVVPEQQGYVEAWQEWEKKYEPQWIEMESRRENGFISGQPDRIGIVHTEYAIVDIKSGAKTWKDPLQIGGYFWLVQHVYDIQAGYIVYVKANGTYHVVRLDKKEMKQALNDYKALYNAYVVLKNKGVIK